MEAFFLGSRVFNWIFGLSLPIMVLTVLSVALGFFTKIQLIKESFTTSNHSINTIAAFSDSQSANTGWSCPEWAGEQSSHCFLWKGQRDGPAAAALPWKGGSLNSGLFQAIRKAAALNLSETAGAATAALASQLQAGFGHFPLGCVGSALLTCSCK